jgi:hypothetical protein
MVARGSSFVKASGDRLFSKVFDRLIHKGHPPEIRQAFKQVIKSILDILRRETA